MSTMGGRIVTASFEDGTPRKYFCGLENCECPDHDDSASLAPGTYITIRLDEDVPVGFWRVTVGREEEGESGHHEDR